MRGRQSRLRADDNELLPGQSQADVEVEPLPPAIQPFNLLLEGMSGCLSQGTG